MEKPDERESSLSEKSVVSEFRVKAGWPDGSVAEQSVVAADIGAARFEIERRGGHVFDVRRKGLLARAARAASAAAGSR